MSIDRLNKALNKVNNEYFSFEKLPYICISQGQDKSKRKMIVFGTYNTKKNEIRIHPYLLKTNISNFVLEFVIYHEMLHYQDRELLQQRKNGQRIHTKEFKQREKQFIKYNEAQKILRGILHGTYNSGSQDKLFGKELGLALIESVNNLGRILNKYNLKDSSKGEKNGTKKRDEKSKLDSND